MAFSTRKTTLSVPTGTSIVLPRKSVRVTVSAASSCATAEPGRAANSAMTRPGMTSRRMPALVASRCLDMLIAPLTGVRDVAETTAQ